MARSRSQPIREPRHVKRRGIRCSTQSGTAERFVSYVTEHEILIDTIMMCGTHVLVPAGVGKGDLGTELF